MAGEILTNEQINSITKLIPSLIDLISDKIIVDYDREADVLYISLDKPQEADDSVLQDNGVIIRYKGKKMVGLTILDASSRNK